MIIETEGTYPKKVCVSIWGDKIDQFGLKEGERITASVNVESREFNNRWYTDVKAWKIERTSQEGAGYEQNFPPPAGPIPPPEEPPLPEVDDDLPF